MARKKKAGTTKQAEKKYQILVFGKTDCDKCAKLNKRLDTLLAKDKWAAFEKVYCDLGTEDGLVAFCNSECINPQRIPAFLVQKRQDSEETFTPVPNPAPNQKDDVLGDSALYTYLGIQTDYTKDGVIRPDMIEAVLDRASAS